jgi:prokaryotic ubiquitin-like protein Pup
MGQEQVGNKGYNNSNDDSEEILDTAEGQERRNKLAEETDDLLDEIDDVLEEDAEDFIRAYVQKGGQ